MNSLFRFVFGFFFLRFFGGGDSGGSENSATIAQGKMLDYNLGKLQQTDALRDPYMAPGLTGAMGAYDKFGDQSYIDKRVGQANIDAQQAIGQNTAAMGRNMARYGLNPASGKFAGMANQNAVSGAAMQAGAMNTVRTGLEDQQTTAAVNKWKLLNDMQTDSMSQGNQIASSIGQMGSVQAQNAQAANAVKSNEMNAVGQLAGAAAGLKMAGAWKDGGRVGYAQGGRAGMMERGMEGMQIAPAAVQGPDPLEPVANAASSGAQAYKMGKAYQAANAYKASQAGMLAAQEAGMGLGTAVGSTLAPQTVAALASNTAAAGTAAAGTGAAAAGTGAAASGLGAAAAANAWNPVGWVLGGLALFGALNRAEGGPVGEAELGPVEQRAALFAEVFPGEEYTGSPEQNAKMITFLRGVAAQQEVDGTGGGMVDGPGTKTSDSVPANLSKGEYVVNADAVEQPGVLPALEAINQKGLEQRQNLASGGLAGFVGGLGAGLTTGYGLGTKYLEQKDARAFRDANKKAKDDSRAEAEASGGLRHADAVDEEEFTGMRVGKNYTQDFETAKMISDQDAFIDGEKSGDQWTNVKDEKVGVSRQVEVPKKSAAQIYTSKFLPQLEDQLIGQGKLTEAKALREWAQDRSRAEALDKIGGAMSALDAKDNAGAAKNLTKFYNSHAMPDGMFAVVTPGKGGQYTIKRFDDKTGKLVDENTGDGESLFRQSIGYLTGPEGVVKHAVAEAQAKRVADAALAQEQRGYAHAEKLEGLKASNATPTQLEKYWGYVGRLRAERAATTDPAQIKVIDEKLASADAAIRATGINQFMATMNTIANTNQDNRTAAAGLSISQANLGMKAEGVAEKRAEKARDLNAIKDLKGKYRVDNIGFAVDRKTGKRLPVTPQGWDELRRKYPAEFAKGFE
jgi:hypothetical protein